jgi:16S rRNA U516 pseudouridylate synthase RsuA-like enzyme
MMHVWGGRVVRLHREAIGDLELPADIRPGMVREATRAELRAMGLARVCPWWRLEDDECE